MILWLSALLLQEPDDVERLIRRLDSEKIEERDQAAGELLRRGEAVLPRLETLAATTKNAEVDGRARGIIRDILVSPEIRTLIESVTAGRWSWYGAPERPALREEMKVGIARELRQKAPCKEAYGRLVARKGPGSVEDWKAAQEGIDALKKEGTKWCLASGLFHSSYLVQLRCAEALADLKDRAVTPVLLDVAAALAVPVDGSKEATVHGFRQHGIARAIDRLLGTSAAWSEGQNTDALKRALEIWKEASRTP